MRQFSKSSRKKTFKNETEEADWWASPEGRKTVEDEMNEGIRDGSARFEPAGKNVKRTDPAVLAQLIARAKAKQTQPISLRIPLPDIEAAKAIAAEAGIGYQTVLKEAITKGLKTLRRAS